MASDFHTHHLPAPGVAALISGKVIVPEFFTSLQYHPWHLPETFSPPDIPENLTGFNAIGEIGLDKLRGPDLAIQQEYLRYFLALAQDTKLPVVLHIVKCYQELFEIIKPFRLKFMLHGFCGSLELLQELWKRDITVSFNARVLNRPDLLAQLQHPAGKFGFESDDDPELDIRDILTQTGIKNIETTTDRCFKDFVMV